jgi:hypothetical protein
MVNNHSTKGRSAIYTINLVIIGFVVAITIQIFQKYATLKSFFNVRFFLVLTILSVLTWVISFAIGGWSGISISNIALSLLIVALSGLLSSFVINLLNND